MLDSLKVHPLTAKAWQWGRLLAATGFTQLVVQILGLLSGILVIRLLPVEEYALYTLANTTLGTMTILADGGIASGVMAQGGKVWKDRGKLGEIIVTGMALRRKFAVGSFLVATPVLLYLTRHHGASWLMSGLLALSLMPAFFATLSGTILEIAPKLKQDIRPLQGIRISSNIGRLFLTGLFVFVFPFAGVAIIASGVSQIYANFRLLRLSQTHADRSVSENEEVKLEILKTVKRILPGSIYYCVSGQLSIWLISIFGKTESIAQIGALGRLTMMLSLFSTVLATLVVPRFARLPKKTKILVSRFIGVQVLSGVIGFILVLLVRAFPDQVLWVLGAGYEGLGPELVLMVISSSVALLGQVTAGLMNGRGIIPPPALFIPIMVLFQASLLFLFDFSVVLQVIAYGVTVSVVIVVFRYAYFFGLLRGRAIEKCIFVLQRVIVR